MPHYFKLLFSALGGSPPDDGDWLDGGTGFHSGCDQPAMS